MKERRGKEQVLVQKHQGVGFSRYDLPGLSHSNGEGQVQHRVFVARNELLSDFSSCVETLYPASPSNLLRRRQRL